MQPTSTLPHKVNLKLERRSIRRYPPSVLALYITQAITPAATLQPTVLRPPVSTEFYRDVQTGSRTVAPPHNDDKCVLRRIYGLRPAVDPTSVCSRPL